MARAWFIAGTDTGVGKTLVSTLLLQGLTGLGRRAVGMKPVASGGADHGAGLQSDDALQLRAASNVAVDYALTNPYAFAEPIAPHIAAADAGVAISPALIRTRFAALCACADAVVVEGVGGWRVPINANQTMADVAQALGAPVILVVGLRLGCLNHALLTADALAADGAPFIGWVANGMAGAMERQADNLAALQQRLPAPHLATIPHQPTPMQRAAIARALAVAVLSD